MTGDLRDLYQEVILDHNKKPRNFYKMEGEPFSAEGFNPLCGDQITLYLKLKDEVITEISFQGSGCAISRASTSLMTTLLKGKTKSEAKELFEKFQQTVTGKETDQIDTATLGKLAALVGVKEYPVRIKCATLAWHTLRAILESKKEVIFTE